MGKRDILEAVQYAFGMTKKKLYELLERAQREHDTETEAALRWAIFQLEGKEKQ